jgi:superfamily I DNA and/or RNA helicase
MHFDFGGSRADSNGSRANPQEAEKVVRLVCLLANQANAEDSYSWVCRSIAIVTPFTGQRGMVLKSLREAGQRLGRDDRSGSACFLRKHVSLGERSAFVVGTVHSLQGAEKSIVIMSAGYAAGERSWHFINKAPNFMNVAASRAQSVFIMACCGVDQNPDTPLGIAGEHIEEIGKVG